MKLITPPGKHLVAAALALSALALATPATAQRATVRVDIDTSGASTRVVLTHSEQVGYAIDSDRNKLEISYARPVLVEPSELRVGDPILSRYEFRGDQRIVFRLGDGYRTFESFELRNPFRLVLDLQGTRPEQFDPAATSRRGDPNTTVVVLDPGHGGIEEGAVGPTGLREKDVTLDIARRLKRALERDRGLSVVLTRDEDRLVGLDERTAIANHNRAALFVSIHLNSSPRQSATGAETYFLNADATDDEARTLAALENDAAGVGTVVTTDGERRDLDLVLWDLAQNRYLAESSMLAENIQRRLNELTGTRDRGVRQAPFRVLMGATMPAILVEVGFISNPDEEARFRDGAYVDSVVRGLTEAVQAFLAQIRDLSTTGGAQ